MQKEYDLDKLKKRDTKPKVDKTSAKLPISLRIDGGILAIIKSEAEKKGLPYQTFISSILYQFAKGELIEKKLIDILKNLEAS